MSAFTGNSEEFLTTLLHCTRRYRQVSPRTCGKLRVRRHSQTVHLT